MLLRRVAFPAAAAGATAAFLWANETQQRQVAFADADAKPKVALDKKAFRAFTLRSTERPVFCRQRHFWASAHSGRNAVLAAQLEQPTAPPSLGDR